LNAATATNASIHLADNTVHGERAEALLERTPTTSHIENVMSEPNQAVRMEGRICSKGEGAKELAAAASDDSTAFFVITESKGKKVVFTNWPASIAKEIGRQLGLKFDGRPIAAPTPLPSPQQ
jgi:hypothetical protein